MGVVDDFGEKNLMFEARAAQQVKGSEASDGQRVAGTENVSGGDGITNELGMLLKINKMIMASVELPGKDCDKDNQQDKSRPEG